MAKKDKEEAAAPVEVTPPAPARGPVVVVLDADGNVVCEVGPGEGCVLEDGWTTEVR